MKTISLTSKKEAFSNFKALKKTVTLTRAGKGSKAFEYMPKSKEEKDALKEFAANVRRLAKQL